MLRPAMTASTANGLSGNRSAVPTKKGRATTEVAAQVPSTLSSNGPARVTATTSIATIALAVTRRPVPALSSRRRIFTQYPAA